MDKKDIFFSFLSGLLLVLSFPNFDLWILAWFGFVPLFFALENKKFLQRFLLSYFTGVIFFLGTLYWLYHVSVLGLVLLVLYLAIYFGLFGLVISSFSLLFIPSLWVLLEYLRSHLFTGFGWVLLGYSQYLNLPVIQITDLTGIWGLSFLIMMVNVAIYNLLIRFRLPFTVYRLPKSVSNTRYMVGDTRNIIIISLVILIAVFSYGFYRLHSTLNTQHSTPIKVSVIQGNIPQEIKWEESVSDFILEKYFDLTKRATEDSPHLIIWPEASYPETLYYSKSKEELSRLVNFIEEIKIPVLLGVVIEDRSHYFNSAVLICPKRKELQRYDKLHLVPFGEYIPLRKIFRFLETIYPIGSFTPGKEYKVFTLTTNYYLPPNFSVLICFEDIFPQISRKFVKKGVDFLVNITNDAWFGRTSAPHQHLQASVFRAVENRRFLIRAANTGVSCFITQRGEIISKIENKKEGIFISGYKTEEILETEDEEGLTFYTRFGDYFIFLCFLICSYGIIQMKPKLMERKRT